MELRTEIYGIKGLDRCGWAHRRSERLANTKVEKEALQQALLHLFLAGDAVAGPRHSFQTLLLKFLVAGDAFAETVVFDAR
jgi:hypothetical protein